MSYDHEHGACERFADGIAAKADRLSAEVARLRAERDELREALRKHGLHDTDCPARFGNTRDCDCGLAAALGLRLSAPASSGGERDG